MATLYGIATSLVAMGQRGDLNDTQRDWIAERDRCGGDISCLRDAYVRRIHHINKISLRYRIPRAILRFWQTIT